MSSAAAALNITNHEHEERLLAVTLAPTMFEACLGCATVGILLFMCVYGLNLHMETPKELRQGRRFYVAISFILLFLHSIGELPYTYYIFQLLYKTSNWQEAYSLVAELDMTWWSITSNWASFILVWVGDGLMVYRCHVIWTGRPMVTVLPATVFLAAVGISIFDEVTYLTGSEYWNAYAAWIFLSVGVNCIVTFLISLRLLRMRRQNAANRVPVDSKLYISVVSILVESALPLALAGVIAAGIIPPVRFPSAHPKSLSIMHNVFLHIWNNLSALAPALIIFRVAAGRSWDHNTRNDSHISTLAFQPHTSHSSSEMREVGAAPLDSDIEKNGPDGVRGIRDHITGSNSDFAEGSSSLRPETRRRGSF